MIAHRESTASTRIRSATSALLAAAEVLDPSAPSGTQDGGPNAVTRTWQHASWGYVSSVPELKSAMMYVGNCLSQVKLQVGKRNPDGSVDALLDETTEGVDSTLAAQAAEIVSTIRMKLGGQSELNRSFGQKMFVAGELYLVPEDTPGGTTYEVLSTQELMKSGDSYIRYYGPGYDPKPLPEGVEPIRVWRPDSQYSMMADSSVRSCLEILEELVILTRLVRSSAISRMALSGILLIADELDGPTDQAAADGTVSEASHPLMFDIMTQAAKAIDDPANAAAWVPYLAQVPIELLERCMKHIPFQTDDTVHVVKRREALERLAQGLDLPVEATLGHQQCVDLDTEILTVDGWRAHDQIAAGDVVFTLNHQTGLAEWQTVERVSVFPADGRELVSIEGKAHSSLSTLDHRWPVIARDTGERRWRQSTSINTNDYVQTAARLVETAEPKWSDDLVELVAWFYTEGHVDRRPYRDGGGLTVLTQSVEVNPEMVDRIRGLLSRLLGPASPSLHATGPTWRSPGRAERRAWVETRPGRNARFRLSHQVTADLEVCAPDRVPTFEFLRSLSPAQLDLFLDVSRLADGWTVNSGTRMFSQNDERRVDAYEFACVLSGRTPSRWSVVDARHGKVQHLCSVTDRTVVQPISSRRPAVRVRHAGDVWCPTVQNGTWLARRHGRVHFTGNTTFANAAQISEDTFKIHIEPMVAMLCDALTYAVLWPELASGLGLDPDRVKEVGYPPEVLTVAVSYDATKLISRPDRAKDIIELYTKDPSRCSVRIAEVRLAVGLDPDEAPDDDEVARRVDAERLTRIREVIAAPPGDAAVPIAEADNAVKPGQSAGQDLIGEQAKVAESEATKQAALAQRIAGGLEMTIERIAEKVGVKLRARLSKMSAVEKSAVSSADNAEIARILGAAVVQRVLGDDDPIAAELATVEKTVARWAAEIGHPSATLVAKRAAQLGGAIARDRLYGDSLTLTPELCAPLVGVT